MPRLRQVPRAEAHPLAQQIYTMLFGDRDPGRRRPGTATGTPGNWWTVFALVPDCFDHAVAGFQFYRSPRAQARSRSCASSARRAPAGRAAASSSSPSTARRRATSG